MSSGSAQWCDCLSSLSKLIFLFLLSFSGTFSSPSTSPPTFHRCRSLTRNETTTTLLGDLQESRCIPCDHGPITSNSNLLSDFAPETHMHVIVLLTTQNAFEKCMVTTSGLLSQGHRVTMLSGPNMPPESAIRPALSQHMPCHQQKAAQSLLTFKTFYFNPQTLPCLIHGQDPMQSPGDIIYCSILNAAPLVLSMSEALASVDEPSVLLLDATSVAGLLIAEHFLIPSLMIVEQVGVLRHVLGAYDSLDRLPFLHPLFIYRLVQDRLNSLDLTSAFIALNRVRRSLGLGRLRTISDLWRAPGNILWTGLPSASPWQSRMRNLIVYSGPFLPPCVPCDPGLVKKSSNWTASATNSSVVVHTVVVSVAFRNDHLGREKVRALLNGLALARESIREMNQGCRQINLTGCWRGPENFRVVLTGPVMSDFELPAFAVNVESAFLDILASFTPTAALISLCDAENSWTRLLGPPVLCLDQRWTPRDLATQLIRLLRSHDETLRDRVQENDQDDVLYRVIKILQEMSKVKARDGDNWSTGWEMGHDVMMQLGLEEGASTTAISEHEAYLPSLLLYPALGILLYAALYLLTKGSLHYLLASRTRWIPRRQARLMLASMSNGLLSRLPELDVMWVLWKSWVQEISNQMTESSAKEAASIADTNASAVGNGSTENGGVHSKKRNKPSKKRN